MMRIHDNNLSLVIPYLDKIKDFLQRDTLKLSQLNGIQLYYEIDFGMLRDNTEFIIVAKALNPLGIGIVPYEYKYQLKRFTKATLGGLTDITTKNTIYININVSPKHIQRVSLHELIHIIKIFYPEIYNLLLGLLRFDDEYINFRKSIYNIKLLKDAGCPKGGLEDESIANFFTLNPDNQKIPYAFFYKLNFPNRKVTLPPSQQKYLYMLLDLVSRIRS